MKKPQAIATTESLKFNLGLGMIAIYNAVRHGSAAINSGTFLSWHAAAVLIALTTVVICATGLVRNRGMHLAAD